MSICSKMERGFGNRNAALPQFIQQMRLLPCDQRSRRFAGGAQFNDQSCRAFGEANIERTQMARGKME